MAYPLALQALEARLATHCQARMGHKSYWRGTADRRVRPAWIVTANCTSAFGVGETVALACDDLLTRMGLVP